MSSPTFTFGNGFAPPGAAPAPAADDVIETTTRDFVRDVLDASKDKPVLVDFWAEWCGPCKMIAPILDDIASQYAGRLKVAKINIDDNPTTPANFAVRGIPTLMLFKSGSVEATKVGALSKSQLTTFIDSHL